MEKEIKVYALKEVAEISKMSMSTIHRHLKAGILEANKIGAVWRVTQEQLEKYIKGE